MMAKGTTHALDEEDLWDLPEEDTAQGLSAKLKKHWSVQLAKKRLAHDYETDLVCSADLNMSL